jgi:hypothetical protein
MQSDEAKSLREFRDDWQAVQQAIARSLRVGRSITSLTANQDKSTDHDSDPFDCQDLAIPPIHTQVDRTADDFVRRWRTLDHRKIVVDGERPYWYRRKVRLPDNFRFDQAPADNAAAADTDERVICLDNPANTESYSAELCKLLDKVKTTTKIYEKTFSGHGLRRVAALADKDDPARKRMRLAQQHDVVPHSARPLVATMRFECWKNLPSIDSIPDKNRLVLEFSESQTLHEVHDAIVAMAASNSGDSPIVDDQGFFFIEGKIFVSRDAPSLVSIVDWLQSDGTRLTSAGIDAGSIIVKKMEETIICDLKCRLGVRYCHQSSSSFESAIFVTDRRMTSSGHSFPILHDIWLHSETPCEACLSQPAAKVTATTSYLGHRALCSDCCRQLQVPDSDQRGYTVWEAG